MSNVIKHYLKRSTGPSTPCPRRPGPALPAAPLERVGRHVVRQPEAHDHRRVEAANQPGLRVAEYARTAVSREKFIPFRRSGWLRLPWKMEPRDAECKRLHGLDSCRAERVAEWKWAGRVLPGYLVLRPADLVTHAASLLPVPGAIAGEVRRRGSAKVLVSN